MYKHIHGAGRYLIPFNIFKYINHIKETMTLQGQKMYYIILLLPWIKGIKVTTIIKRENKQGKNEVFCGSVFLNS